MEETMRAVLAPALEQFKRLVASKRARGATDHDISKMLGEIEASMREIGVMSDAQIKDSMQIYHEALREETTKEDARNQADAILGTLFDLVRDGMAEERKKGTSEAEIQQKIDDVCRTIEHEQRGRVPDRALLGILLPLIDVERDVRSRRECRAKTRPRKNSSGLPLSTPWGFTRDAVTFLEIGWRPVPHRCRLTLRTREKLLREENS